MSKITERMGQYAYGRLSDALTDAVREALDHGVSVRDFIIVAQEAWNTELYDRTKDDFAEFDKFLYGATPTATEEPKV